MEKLSFTKMDKGDRLSFEKVKAGMTKIRIGLGWDTNRYSQKKGGTDPELDLDVSVFLLNSSGKLTTAKNLVYFNSLCRTEDGGKNVALAENVQTAAGIEKKWKPCSPDGAVVHSGDNLTGSGDGDDETILIDTSLLAPDITNIAVIVSIFDNTGKINFGQVDNAYAKLYDDATGQVFAQVDLSNDLASSTSVNVGEIYLLPNGGFGFKNVSSGFKQGLEAFFDMYKEG